MFRKLYDLCMHDCLYRKSKKQEEGGRRGAHDRVRGRHMAMVDVPSSRYEGIGGGGDNGLMEGMVEVLTSIPILSNGGQVHPS